MSADAGRTLRGDVGWMSAGTLLIGLSGYVFLALIGHGRFDPMATAALSSTYLLANILGPGLFVAVEQESSRLASRAAAVGGAGRRGAVRLLACAAAIALLTVALLLAFREPVTNRVLRGDTGLLIAVLVSVAGSAVVFWVRGIAGGQHRFRRYGTTLLIDAGVRITGCAALALFGVDEPVAFGLALCCGPLVAGTLTWRGLPTEQPRSGAGARSATSDAAGWPGLIGAVAALLLSSVLAMAMANLSPVLLNAELPTEPALAAGFAAALVLTRVPLLLMGPVQALVLPRLTEAVALNRTAEFRRQLATGLSVVGGLGVAAVGGAWLLGRPVMRLVFGPAADVLPAGTLALLALAAAMLMGIALLQPAMVALGRQGGMLLGWAVGAALFTAAFALPLPPVDRALLAQLIGPAGTLVVHLGLASTARPGTTD